MSDSIRLTQISTIVYLITKVKQLSNYIYSFKQGVNEYLEAPYDFSDYVDYYGEGQAQKVLDKAITRLLSNSKQSVLIAVGDYLLKIPKVDMFLDDVKTLDDLAKALDIYLQAFPKKQKKLVEYQDPKELGIHSPFAELPLYQAEPFINKFHEVLNQSQALPYILTPVKLNSQLKIMFAGKEEAEEYARKLFPSELWRKKEDGSGLDKVGSY